MSTGFVSQFGTMAGLLWTFYLILIPLYFFGPRIRAWCGTKI